jgi:gamma-glutamyl:cysteine ligase YbdK (ATP-grasp superfamily)
MTIIALIIFGFVLLAFALIFRPRHDYGVDKMLKQNHNVQPLLKQRSAQFKYNTLHELLKDTPNALQSLKQLQSDFNDKIIAVDAYHDALEVLEQQHIKH